MKAKKAYKKGHSRWHPCKWFEYHTRKLLGKPKHKKLIWGSDLYKDFKLATPEESAEFYKRMEI